MKLLPSFQLIGIAGLLGLALGAGGAWRVTSWAHAAHEKAEVEAARETERQASAKIVATLKQQIADGVAASQGFQNEVIDLRRRAAAAPAPDVRLCRAPRANHPDPMPAASDGARGSDAGAPAPGLLPFEAGRNIGPGLYSGADEADEIAAQLRALQAWARRVSHDSGSNTQAP